MTDRAPWLPSDEEINEICNEDDNPDYQPGEFSFVTNPNLVHRLIERAVLKGQIEALDYISAALTSSESFERVAEVRARILEKKPGGGPSMSDRRALDRNDLLFIRDHDGLNVTTADVAACAIEQMDRAERAERERDEAEEAIRAMLNAIEAPIWPPAARTTRLAWARDFSAIRRALARKGRGDG